MVLLCCCRRQGLRACDAPRALALTASPRWANCVGHLVGSGRREQVRRICSDRLTVVVPRSVSRKTRGNRKCAGLLQFLCFTVVSGSTLHTMDGGFGGTLRT